MNNASQNSTAAVQAKIWIKNLQKADDAVAYLVKTACYKLEDRRFDSRWPFDFSIVLILPAALWLWDTRNIHGGKGRPAREADNLTAIC
jgi:hypothetical protein